MTRPRTRHTRRPSRRPFFRQLRAEPLENRLLMATLNYTLLDPTGNAWGFGSGVSISPNWTAVGSYQANDQVFSQAGLAYVFDSSGALVQTLHNPTPANNDLFGFRTAIDGNVVAVSAPNDNGQRGAVYLFDAPTGNLLHSIVNPVNSPNSYFGDGLSMSGGKVLAGATFAGNVGEAYLFDAATGNLLKTLSNPNASPHDRFGTNVAIDGNIAVVGSYGEDAMGGDAGAAYIFDATTGNLLHTLFDPVPQATDNFGYAVAVSGNLVVVSAHGDDSGSGGDSGTAFVFDAITGNLVSTLSNPTPSPSDVFSGAVAISGNTAVIGAYGDSSNAGAVYIFDAQTGALTDTLHQPNPQSGDNFGSGVAISGKQIAAAAGGVDIAGSDSGAVFVISLETFDFGDAPDKTAGTKAGNYQTRFVDNGPRHTIVPGLFMGARVDAESDGLPHITSHGDDLNQSPDDEDGIGIGGSQLSYLPTKTAPTVVINVTNTTGTTARLNGWIDYDLDGQFDISEHAFATVPSNPNNVAVTLNFPKIPPYALTGATAARFRLSTDSAANSPTGAASDGEVEDHFAVTVHNFGSGKGKGTQKISDTSGGLSPGNAGGVLRNNGFFGRLEPLGDFNGDGVPDMVVGANADSDGGPNRGAIYLVYLNPDGSAKEQHKISETSGNLTPSNAGGLLPDFAAFGSSVATLGDLDGDGVVDLAVGAYHETGNGPAHGGAVHILLMNADGTVKQHQAISDTRGGLSPNNAGGVIQAFDIFGFAVEALGDINGDDVPDLAVSAVNADDGGPNRGAVYLLHLNSDGTVQSHLKISDTSGGLSPGNAGGVLQNNGYFGVSIAALGDLNGDGFSDLAVGSLDDDGGSRRGAMRVLFLGPMGTVASSQKISESQGFLSPGNRGGVLRDDDEFGRSAAPLGDFDGDGVADMAVALYGDDGGPNRGAMEILFLNSDGTVKRRQRISDTQGGLSPNNAGGTLRDGARFASRGIALLGDLDGDGVPELAASATDDSDGGPNRGAVYIVFSEPATPACNFPALAGASGDWIDGEAQFLFDGPDLSGKDGACAAIGLDLINVGLEYAVHQATTPAVPFQPSHPLLQVAGDRVLVEAVADGDVAVLTRDLENLGMAVEGSFQQLVSGSIPLTALDDLAQLDSLRFSQPAYRPMTNVVTEGDAVINGPAARSHSVGGNPSLDGTGVTVGVLSDSFHPSASSVGELPSVAVLPGQAGIGNNEGNAMLEIVHDVAPGAALSFDTAFGSQLTFRKNILGLAAAGADVLVDDVIHFAEPMFLDGMVAQAVDEVVADGVAYFSAAGNVARRSYENAFVSSGQKLPGSLTGDLHDFGGGDAYQAFTVPIDNPGTTYVDEGAVLVSFQWDSTLASLGCTGSESEIDLHWVGFDAANFPVVLKTAKDINLGNDPIIVSQFSNDGSYDVDQDGLPDTLFAVAIELVSGPAPGLMKYVEFTRHPTFLDFALQVNKGTAYGHSNAAGAIAVGAAAYNTPTMLEPFSSAGGVPILFSSTDANCCTRLPQAVIRETPDIVAPDGVTTSVAGFAPFFGTSAAAPHAAAAAALMLHATGGGGSLSPAQVEFVLESTATDMLPTDFDYDSGYGFIDADKAVIKLLGGSSGGGGNAALATPVVSLDVPNSALINEQFNFSVSFDNGSATQIGYGPFVDVLLDFAGADGVFNFTNDPADGLVLTNLDVFDENGPLPASQIHLVTIGATGTEKHPFAVNNSGQPLMVQGQPGDVLAAVQLSFGSFAPSQPPTHLTFKPRISNLADLGHPLYVRARGGFQYGQDPLAPLAGDGTFVIDPADSSRWTEQFVTPEVLIASKANDAPESETATGPNFPRTWSINVDIANLQSIGNLKITDPVSGAVMFGQVSDIRLFGNSVTSNTSIVTHSFNSTTRELTVQFVNPVVGTSAKFFNPTLGTLGDDVQIDFTFYVPDLDADGQSVLDAKGNPRLIGNNVKAAGDWTPNDGRDQVDANNQPLTFVGNAASCPCGPADVLVARSIAIQKSVAAVNGGPPVGNPVQVLPNDMIDYVLNFQISDYFGFEDLIIDDFYTDGQLLKTSVYVPTLTIFTNGVPTSVTFSPTNYSDTFTPDGDPHTLDTHHLRFNVSQQMIDSGIDNGTGQLLGGLFKPSSSGGNDGPTTGVVRFQTQVLDAYLEYNHSGASGPDGDAFLNEHDELGNRVLLTGELLDANCVGMGMTQSDDSQVDLQVRVGQFEKEIYAFNGSTSLPPFPLYVAPSETVTYKLTYTLQPGDFERFSITDFLPHPFFDATKPDGTNSGWTYTAFGPFPPPAAGRYFVNLVSVGATPTALYPTLTTDPNNNSVTWDFGTLADPANDGGVIEIYYTVAATTDPFADGLFLTNQGVSEHQDTSLHPIVDSDTAQIVSSEPKLRITKGVVAVSPNEKTQITPALVGPAFTNPCTTGFRTTGGTTLNSTNLPGVVNRDLTGADAGDIVTFMIVVENTGSSKFGAFDVVVKDSLPPGFVVPTCAAGLNLSVTDGAGVAMPFNGLGAGSQPHDLFGNGIELIDPGATAAQSDGTDAGSIDRFDPFDGQNVLIITYDLQLTGGVVPGDKLTNAATLVNYASGEGGPDFNDRNDDSSPINCNPDTGDPTECAMVTIGPGTLTKSLIATSETDTAGDQVTIGEIVRYRLVVQVPEGSLPGVTITDHLPSGLQFLDDGTAAIASVTNGGGISLGLPFSMIFGNSGNVSPTATIPSSWISGGPFASGDDPTFILGDLFNNDRDADCEFIVIEFNALVTNTPGNQAGDVERNSFTLTIPGHFSATSNEVPVRIVEPRLKVDKTAQIVGNVVQYTVTITNIGSSTAFDATFSDVQFVGPAIQFDLSPGAHDNITIRYETPLICDDIRNEAIVTYSSLPGTHGTIPNPTGSQTPGNPGDADGERVYFASDTVLVPNPCGSIHGFKFEDLNADGDYDIGEPLLADVEIVLTWVDPQTGQTMTRTTTTMANGEYWFTDLLPGVSYTVTELAPQHSKQTTPNPPPITLQPGQKYVAQKFIPNLFASDVVSLQAAVATANANPGPDVIELAAGVYLLPSELVIMNDSLTIFGMGTATIQGTLTRLFHVTGGTSLTLDNLTLTNGQAGVGGAILNDGTLTVQYSTLSGNHAAQAGGAIYNNSLLTLDHVTLTSNSASMVGGGAIWNQGELFVSCSNFEFNSTDGVGGGAIYNAMNSFTAIRDTSFTENLVSGPGLPAASNRGGGAIYNAGFSLEIDSSTFEANSVHRILVVGGDGGGAILNTTNLVVRNSTFSQNRAGTDGGGAILNNGTSFRLENSTIAENIAEQGGLGGGVLQAAGAANTIQNTIIALNTISPTLGGGTNAVAHADVSGAFTSFGHNLIGNGDGASGFGTIGDQVGTALAAIDPRFDSFGLHDGCLTKTYRLHLDPFNPANNSPAIDAGIDAAGLGFDQRGMFRPIVAVPGGGALGGDFSDIGAFEATPVNIALACKCDSLIVQPDLAFGNAFLGSVHLVKFHDRNGDGVYDSGNEATIPDVVFGLTTTDPTTGQPVTQYATTMANGEAWFTGLMAGMNYTVREIPKALIVNAPAAPLDGAMFTITVGSTSAFFEFDVSGGSPGVSPGKTPVLVPANSPLNSTANQMVAAIAAAGLGFVPLNLGNGKVLLGDANAIVATGLSKVVSGPVNGWQQTTMNPPPIFIGSGQEYVATTAQAVALVAAGINPNKIVGEPKLAFGNRPRDIGNFFLGAIEGVKFDDVDGDGHRDPGERGVPFVRIYLDTDNDGSYDLGEPTTLTMADDPSTPTIDESGRYWFPNLGPGTYQVREVVPAYATQMSFPPPITIQSGEIWVGQSGMVPIDANHRERVEERLLIGNHYEGYGEIHACKFNDLNGNGSHDDGEPALAGVKFTLQMLGADGQFHDLEMTTTASTGGFWFKNLLPGTYRLIETPPLGSIVTTPPLGDIVLLPGEVISFGECPMPGSVHGQVWREFFQYGVHNVNEPGMNGVTVRLFDATGTILLKSVQTMSMDLNGDSHINHVTESGLYWFTDVAPGTYTVKEVKPSGFVQTFPTGTGTHTVIVTAGGSVQNVDFANRKKFIWFDSEVFPGPLVGGQLPAIASDIHAGDIQGSRVADLTTQIIDPAPEESVGIAVIGADNSQGVWEFSTNGGGTWLAMENVSPMNAVLLGAGPDDRVRFVPAAGLQGTVDSMLTFRAWDESDGRVSGTSGVDASLGGGETPFSHATGTITVTVLAHDARLRLQIVDAAGQPIDSILVGREFFLEGYAAALRGPRPSPVPPTNGITGVFAAYEDVLYDATLVSPAGPIEPGMIYTSGRSGSLAVAGVINEVGGIAGAAELGPGEFLLFRLPMTAAAVGDVDFFANAAEATGHEVYLYGDNQAVPSSRVEFVGTTLLVHRPFWQNQHEPLDISGDGRITALDALLIVNELNLRVYSNADSELPMGTPPCPLCPPPYLDPTGDNRVTPLDLLQVINRLNERAGVGASFGAAGGEAESADENRGSADAQFATADFRSPTARDRLFADFARAALADENDQPLEFVGLPTTNSAATDDLFAGFADESIK